MVAPRPNAILHSPQRTTISSHSPTTTASPCHDDLHAWTRPLNGKSSTTPPATPHHGNLHSRPALLAGLRGAILAISWSAMGVGCPEPASYICLWDSRTAVLRQVAVFTSLPAETTSLSHVAISLSFHRLAQVLSSGVLHVHDGLLRMAHP